MSSVLKKLPHPNFSSSSSHQYQQVPLDAESDSEDDEALLYAAPGLNHTQDSKQDVSFGVGLYDHSRDLDLPRIVQLPKKRAKLKGYKGVKGAGQRLFRSKVFACVFVVLSCLLVALIAAFAVLVAGNWDYFSPTSNSSLTSDECKPVPSPLPNSRQKPCSTDGQGSNSTPQPTQAATPATSSELNVHHSNENVKENDEESISVETAPPKQNGESSSTPTVPTLETSNNELADVSSSYEDFTTEASSTMEEPSTTSTKTVDTGGKVLSTESYTTEVAGTTPEDATEDEASTEFRSTGTATTLPDNAEQPPLSIATTNLEPAEIVTGENEEATTSCFPVPSPLSHSPPATLIPLSIDPTPAVDGTHVSQDINGDHHVVNVQTQPVDTAATSVPLHVHTSTSGTSKSSETGPNENNRPQNFGNLYEQEPPRSDTRFFWERQFFPAASEASPRAVDLNRDGTDERLVITDVGISEVVIYALNGRDGSTIWNQTLNFPVFGLRCFEDINDDGDVDCFVSGRGGGLGALSGKDGTVLWFVDRSVIYPRYNFYFPLQIPDMDGDGVKDLVNAHGGDTVYKPKNHDRSPGYLVVVSGKTGQKLMDPILMPDGRETYMSPVLMSIPGSSDDSVILFGSGGETIPGSLWGVTVSSLRSVISAHQRDPYTVILDDTFHPWSLSPFNFPPRPVMDYDRFDVNHTSNRLAHGSCPTWNGKQVPIWNYYDLCLYEFVRTSTKGIILPPVVADVTGDEVDDLIVSTFDGHTIALDGHDLKRRVWDTFFPGTESYRWVESIWLTGSQYCCSSLIILLESSETIYKIRVCV